MIGLSLVNARRSMILDIVDRFVMGRIFFRSVQSRPAFLRSGVIQPAFIGVGKRPAEKDRFVRWQMTMAISDSQYFNKRVGKTSSGEVLVGSRLIIRSTSISLTGSNSDMVEVSGNGGGRSTLGQCGRSWRAVEITSFTNLNLLTKKSLMAQAS